MNENTTFEFVGYDSLEIKNKGYQIPESKAKGKEALPTCSGTTLHSMQKAADRLAILVTLLFDVRQKLVDYDTKKENDLIIHFANKLPVNIDGRS